MANFNVEQQKIIYNAVRYYQINRVTLDSKLYKDCDAILNELFPNVIQHVPVDQEAPANTTKPGTTV
jgi:hypothetical protein